MTGVTPDTLRKWEERYGILTPTRLPNGYRGYTWHDIALIRWLQVQLAGGSRISLVAEEARNRLNAGWNPEFEPPVESTEVVAKDRPILEEWRAKLLNSLIRTQTDSARQHLDTIFSLYEVETVLTKILDPILKEIGRLWEKGEISEYQEHFSSVIIRDRLSAFRAQMRSGQGPTLITACLPGELHEIGALIVSILAVRRGFHVIHLSGSPSPQGLCRAIAELNPHAICLSVSTKEALSAGLPHLTPIAATALQAKGNPQVLVGGRAIAMADSLPVIPGITFVRSGAAQALDVLGSERRPQPGP